MKGFLIDIEGLDGCGKETQTKLLYEYINERNPEKVKYISFPDYKSDSSSLVKMYLNGEFGKNPFDVNAYAASSFFAVDRFASYKKGWEKDYQAGKCIIANRYVSSNSLYQMAKLEKSEWENYLTWSYDYEYNKLGLPKPNITIYLSVPIEVSQDLMNKRYMGDSNKKDLHEANVNFLNLCKNAAEYAAKQGNWEIINCVENNKLKSIEKIQEEIILIIKNKHFGSCFVDYFNI